MSDHPLTGRAHVVSARSPHAVNPGDNRLIIGLVKFLNLRRNQITGKRLSAGRIHTQNHRAHLGIFPGLLELFFDQPRADAHFARVAAARVIDHTAHVYQKNLVARLFFLVPAKNDLHKISRSIIIGMVPGVRLHTI